MASQPLPETVRDVTTPLMVSCLMVTGGRLALMQQAVACFHAQTYRPRELVIVTDESSCRDLIERHLDERGLGDVRLVLASGPGCTLGELRNLALDSAAGSVVAQWDDDDLSHPARLAVQMDALGRGALASFLTEQLQYFAPTRELFVTDWRKRIGRIPIDAVPDCIPGTGVFVRSPELRYPLLRRGEDSVMLEQLHWRGAIARVSGAAYLSLYRFHESNTFDEAHWRQITRWACNRAELRARRLAITLGLGYYARFLGSDPVTVRDDLGRRVYVTRPAPWPASVHAGEQHDEPARLSASGLADAPAQPAGADSPPPLRITVAIATWNRALLLREALESLAAMDVPRAVSWEVLVCDNASTDDTAHVVEAVAARLPVRYIGEPRQGKSFALLRLIEAASGDWIVFLDDDLLADPGWLAAYVDGIRRHPRAACLVGRVLPWLAEPVSGWRAALLHTHPWLNGLLDFDREETIAPAELRCVHGASVAVQRSLIRLPDDVDTRRGMFGHVRVSGEDLALVDGVLARGGRGWRLIRSVAYHFIPPERTGWRWFLHRQLAEARSGAIKRGMPITGSWRFRLFATGFVAGEVVRVLARFYCMLRWRLGTKLRRRHPR